MTIWICPSEFIICKQDWREREIRKASSMAGMAKEKERKIEEKATQPKSLCFPPLYFSEKKITIRKTCAKIIFQYFIKKVSESIKTSGKTSVPVISGNQRTKLRASSPSNFLLMAVFTTWTCWGKHFGIISKKGSTSPLLGWLPKEGKKHWQVTWGDTTALDDPKLIWSVAYLTMR